MAETLNNEALTRYLGILSEIQNEKMDRDGNNATPPLAALVSAVMEEIKKSGWRFVIETWINPDKPTDGYRIWSDGWCEQWGIVDNGVYAQSWNHTVTLQKPFKDANYIVLASLKDASFVNGSSGISNDGYEEGSVNPSKYTTNGFTLYFYGYQSPADNQRYGVWKASGYLAEGEY